MDIQRRKEAIVEEFMGIQNEAFIALFEQLLKRRESFETESNTSPMSVDQLNKEIDNALADYRSGRIKTARSLLSEIDQWN